MRRAHIMVIIAMSGLAAASLGLSINATGVFYEPVSLALGVSLGRFATHTTVFMLMMAFSSLTVPTLLKKIRFRFLIAMGVFLAVSSTALMSVSTSMISFYLLSLIRGFGVICFSMVPIMATLNHWFIEKKGIVTSIVVSSSGIAGALASLLLGNIIINYGWQTAYLVLALLMIALCLPALLFPYTYRPEEMGLQAYGHYHFETKEIKPELPFSRREIKYLLFLVFTLFMSFLAGFVQYFPNLASSAGMLLSVGTIMLSLAQLGNVLSKLLIGIFIDWIGSFKASLLLLAIALLASFLLFIGVNVSFYYIGAFLYGVIYALGSISVPLLTEHYFGKTHYAVAFATLNMLTNIGGALSQSIYGFMVDALGAYDYVLILVMLLFVLSTFILVLINRKHQASLSLTKS